MLFRFSVICVLVWETMLNKVCGVLASCRLYNKLETDFKYETVKLIDNKKSSSKIGNPSMTTLMNNYFVHCSD